MKRFLLLLLFCLFLTGCSTSSGEKQIFPICMSIDQAKDGKLTIGVQVNMMSSAESTEYTVFTATGDNFSQALEILGASMPYPLHFGQLRLCILSYEYASTHSLRPLLREIASLYTIRPDATVMVALGNARQTMEAQKPDLGVRLSTYLDLLLSRLRQEHLLPIENLTDVVRALGSDYGDPLLGLCALNQAVSDQAKSQQQSQQGGGGGGSGGNSGGGDQPAVAIYPQQELPISGDKETSIGEPSPGDDLPINLQAGALPRQNGNPVEYIGSTTVGNGVVSGILSAQETRMVLLLIRHSQVASVTQTNAELTLEQDCPVAPEMTKELAARLQALNCDALSVGAAVARQVSDLRAFTQFDIESIYPSLTFSVTH
ncbi:MAG: hypothetical protein E7319_04765 [Clostridiales bacterium]|nr:hypothetical protein [Clostridiales bacterium]